MFDMFPVQLDLILVIGNISLLHYCQFGTENHTLLQKINTVIAPVTSSCCSWGVFQVEFGLDVYLDVSLSPCGILVEET